LRFSFDVDRVVPASAETTWDLVTDTTRWAEWGPTVAAVECDDRHVGAGTEGRVQMPVGVWVPFTVTDFEPGHVWRWKVAGLPATGHRVEPFGNDPGTSRVIIEVPFWAAPYAGISSLALRRLERLAVASAG
jgi:uncharacterized protein YndB with AHSA1/START domain